MDDYNTRTIVWTLIVVAIYFMGFGISRIPSKFLMPIGNFIIFLIKAAFILVPILFIIAWIRG